MRAICILFNVVSVILMVVLIVLSAMFMTMTPEGKSFLVGQDEIIIRLCEVLPIPIAFILGRLTSVVSRRINKKENKVK